MSGFLLYSVAEIADFAEGLTWKLSMVANLTHSPISTTLQSPATGDADTDTFCTSLCCNPLCCCCRLCGGCRHLDFCQLLAVSVIEHDPHVAACDSPLEALQLAHVGGDDGQVSLTCVSLLQEVPAGEEGMYACSDSAHQRLVACWSCTWTTN